MKEKMKDLRQSLNLTQKAFADKIGISLAAVKNYEAGKNKPGKKVMEKIKEVFDVDIADAIALSTPEEAAVPEADLSSAAHDAEESQGKMPKTRARAKKAEETVKNTAEKVKRTAKSTGRKVKEAAEPVMEKFKEAAEKMIEEDKKAGASAGKASAKTEPKPPVFTIESAMGGQITVDEVLSRLPEGVERVYVKPEENKAYWVKEEDSGDIELW